MGVTISCPHGPGAADRVEGSSAGLAGPGAAVSDEPRKYIVLAISKATRTSPASATSHLRRVAAQELSRSIAVELDLFLFVLAVSEVFCVGILGIDLFPAI